jgi:hypothetical protein
MNRDWLLCLKRLTARSNSQNLSSESYLTSFRQIIEGVDPVNNSLAAIIKAVRHKADRKEMERLVLERSDTLLTLSLTLPH